ncbi:MAG: alpha-E domain-containing protein [Formivibrio sp.]|nr:alpha-E domain-containing protein [Formivibrio sp.]
MLSRTADQLYWMARYIERAENMARLLDVTWQMSLVPQTTEVANRSWLAALNCSGRAQTYQDLHDEVDGAKVLHFLAMDEQNSSSIYSCLRAARENAHAVRGTLTQEMWETVNSTWLEMAQRASRPLSEVDHGEFFEWVKRRSSLSRGVTFGTMLHDEAFHFIRLGTHLERADNTARLLDVKYHLLAAGLTGGGAGDYYQWGALLRSVSAFEIYRRVYRDVMTPTRVAELLILRDDMPRSLLACLETVDAALHKIANRHSAETCRRAGQLHAELRYGRIEDIVEDGLHPFLSRFTDRIHDLGDRIGQDFLLPSLL